jgi:hypothetical protein
MMTIESRCHVGTTGMSYTGNAASSSVVAPIMSRAGPASSAHIECVQVLLDLVSRRWDFGVVGVGSRSTPLCDIEGSVHWLRSKQQAARFPDLSFESVFSIRIVRVSRFLVEPIQRIQSQRARGVMSSHNLRAC